MFVTFVTFPNKRKIHTKLVCLMLLLNFPFYILTFGDLYPLLPFMDKYFPTIVDDFSRFTWIILMKEKYELVMHVQNFVNKVENQHKTTLKMNRADNGPEFSLSSFYNTKGIQHQMSCVVTPQ